MACGIYAIKNKINDKMYIGQSICIEKRFIRHKCNLKNKKHKNIHLQNSYNKYGIENFEYIIIEECEEKDLSKKEQKWINSTKEIYNSQLHVIDKHGLKNPFYGKKHSDESKEKMSTWKKKHYVGKNNPNYGKKNSKDTLIKMSEGRSKKLKKKDVLEIVSLLKEGVMHKEIADIFKVNRTVITRISNGSRWTNVTGGPVVPVVYENGKRKQNKFHIKNKSESKKNGRK